MPSLGTRIQGNRRKATSSARRRSVPIQHTAGELVSEIYAALLGSSNWETFLDYLSDALPNGKTTLFYHDANAGAGAFSINARFDPEYIATYSNHFCFINPWMRRASTRQVGLGVRAEQMLPRNELLRTEFYNDFLRPQGLESGVGVTIVREDGRNFMLSTLHGGTDDDAADAAASLLTKISPHLRQVFDFYRRRDANSEMPRIVGAAAEALDVAIVAVGLNRRICWSNAKGQTMISSGSIIGSDALGRLTSPFSDLKAAVVAALERAMRGDGVATKDILVPTGPSKSQPTRLKIVVPNMTPFERYFGGPIVLLLVSDAKRAVVTKSVLQASFGLTPSEAGLALSLRQGLSLSEAAQTHGISKETARTHLKGLFAKLGVHRQAEVIRLLHEWTARQA